MSQTEIGSGTVARLGHRPALDGLRGIAVLLVFLYHGEWLGVDSGWIGVDLFFVISGFLITRLLIEEYDATGSIDIGAFLKRRALRLFPALFLLLAVMAALNAMIEIPQEQGSVSAGIWSALLYVRNYHAMITSETGGPLGHLWSLSVEEQFYVIWPFVALALLKRRGASGLAVAATAALGVAAFSTSARWALGTHIDTLYLGTISHGAVGILAGAALGARPQALASIGSSSARLLMFAGLGGLVGLSLIDGLDPAHLTTGFLLISVVCLVSVAGAASSSVKMSGFGIWFRPLIALGKISYGFYLWHLPVIIIVLPRLPEGNWVMKMSQAMAVSLAASLLSYIVVEKPALRLKARLVPPR